MEPLTIKIII